MPGAYPASACQKRRRPSDRLAGHEERLLERPLELFPPERLHDVCDGAELHGVAARSVDRHAEDRQEREAPANAAGEPQARTRRRLEEEQFRLLAVHPFARSHRLVPEPQADDLEQRPGCRIGVDNENHGHGANFGRRGENGGCPWYECGVSVARVLVVDDDDDIRRLVRTLLEGTGASVRDAGSGRDALREFHGWRPDLVVLDVNMPDLDGWTVLERIRDMSEVPVLMLTGRGGELERVRGLQGGADDYVVKPFGKQELVARVQALLRRAGRSASEAERYADSYLAIDWPQARVTVDGREVQLTPLEFRLLSTFVRHPRQVLSREQLLALVWGDALGVGGDQVKLYVGYLRRKLDPDARGSPPIETVRGFGYRYTPPAS
jgi:DNA-binding response OmpR family regulator